VAGRNVGPTGTDGKFSEILRRVVHLVVHPFSIEDIYLFTVNVQLYTKPSRVAYPLGFGVAKGGPLFSPILHHLAGLESTSASPQPAFEYLPIKYYL
jgi:hypothetical protein